MSKLFHFNDEIKGSDAMKKEIRYNLKIMEEK